jgi:undecaprenyl-diphosphatase
MTENNASTSTPEASRNVAQKRRNWAIAAFRRAQLLYARWTFLLACAVLAFGAFVKLTSELNEGELDLFDRVALEQVVALRVPGLNGPAVDLTALGSVSVVTLLCVVSVVLLLLQHDTLAAWQLILAASGGGMLSSLLKRRASRIRAAILSPLPASI